MIPKTGERKNFEKKIFRKLILCPEAIGQLEAWRRGVKSEDRRDIKEASGIIFYENNNGINSFQELLWAASPPIPVAWMRR